ncbi:Large proline-rich protein BAG6 [Larimichthys crocea]|uniref:Uncharacterized protein n=1 Tax=Larimichthys crocea TaxID=215358 RepID=A0ACD3RFN8_LARCR|nr:Large proline-rich protein BAG6 [Larimichthys crocea]
MLSQRKIKAQPPLSDAYLHGMPAKRRKTTQCEGPHLSLSDAVNRAARAAGVLPATAPNSLQVELERPELQECVHQTGKAELIQDGLMFVILNYQLGRGLIGRLLIGLFTSSGKE